MRDTGQAGEITDGAQEQDTQYSECERNTEQSGGLLERERFEEDFRVSDSIDRESRAGSDCGSDTHLNEGIKRLDREIEEKGQGLKGFENITSIKGIGPKGGAILLSVIGDIKDFESSKKLESYFGIVSWVRNSGDHVSQGRITKQGSKLGRTTLVQCTLIGIRYLPYLKKFYLRFKQKKGSGKAIIVTSRKMLSIIYETLRNEWVFEDFANFVIKTN